MEIGEELYNRFRDGDDTAFDRILKLYYDGLLFFVTRYVRDVSTAEDVVIDTFLELLMHRSRYNFKTSLKTYLYTIARNKSLNVLKRKSRTDVALDSVGDNIADLHTIDSHMIDSERKRVISEALAELPEEMRSCIILVYFEDMTYEETAKIMKKSRKQIDNLLYRAKASLKNISGEAGKEHLKKSKKNSTADISQPTASVAARAVLLRRLRSE